MLNQLLLLWFSGLLLASTALATDASGVQPIPREDMQQLKEKMSALAEQIAKEGFQTRLDYSVDSIKQVEQILGRSEVSLHFMKTHPLKATLAPASGS